jgi:hypothetical protein
LHFEFLNFVPQNATFIASVATALLPSNTYCFQFLSIHVFSFPTSSPSPSLSNNARPAPRRFVCRLWSCTGTRLQGICVALGAMLVDKYVKPYVMGVLPATAAKATQASSASLAATEAASVVDSSASSQTASGSAASK